MSMPLPWNMPWRSLSRRPLRTALTILGVAIAVAGLVSMTGLTRGLQFALAKGLQEPGSDLVVSQKSAFTLTGSTLPEDFAPKLAGLQGVESANGVLFAIVTADDDVNVAAIGWPPQSRLWGTLNIVAGRRPAAQDEVMLGENVASALSKHVGDTVTLHFETFRVAGIARFDNVLSQSTVLVSLPKLQDLLDRGRTVSFVELRLTRPMDEAALQAARTRIADAAKGYAVQNTGELARDLRLVRILGALATAIGFAVLALAVLGIANTLLMAVNERTYEIGILSAIGWPMHRIVLLFVVEGLLMALAGAALGVLAGLGIMEAAARSQFALGYLQLYFDRTMLAQALVAAVLIGALGSLYPALRIARMSPAAALNRI